MEKNKKKAAATYPNKTPTPATDDTPYWALPLAFFTPLLMYLLTAAHSVTFEDSGIFISTSATLGLPQPPGYPLYTLVAWIFTNLPLGTIAYRVHIFSGLCMAGATAFLFLSANRLFKGRWKEALLAALLFAFADTIWAQAVVAEVYPLHILLFSMLFYVSIKISETPTKQNFMGFGILFGMALANHWPLLILASPIFLAFAWPQRRAVWRLSWLWSSLAVVVAVAFYLFMMWRSQQGPPVSFLGPLESFTDLYNFISRSYYRAHEEKWVALYWDRFLFFLDGISRVVWQEWYVTGSLCLAAGLYHLRRVLSKTQMLGLLFAFLSTVFFLQFNLNFEFNDLNRNVMRVFHLVPIYVGAIVMGSGIICLVNRFENRAIIGLGIGLVSVLAINFQRNNLRTDNFAESYVRFIFDAIPKQSTPRALLAATDADVGPMAYVGVALGERPDLRLYTQAGVFFKDRLFSPFETAGKVRYEKTLQFIRERDIVYSTKTMDIFAKVESVPLSREYNGIFYEISPNPVVPLRIGDDFTQKAVALLDSYVANPRSSNWRYHREIIAARLCNFIVLRRVEHPVYKTSPACMQVWARYLNQNKRYAEADEVYSLLIKDSWGMIDAERHLIRNFQLTNKLDKINSEAGTLIEKKARVIAAIEEVKEGLFEYPVCGNRLFIVIYSLRTQVELPSDVQRGLELFKDCKKN